jgi:hypothetical protein
MGISPQSYRVLGRENLRWFMRWPASCSQSHLISAKLDQLVHEIVGHLSCLYGHTLFQLGFPEADDAVCKYLTHNHAKMTCEELRDHFLQFFLELFMAVEVALAKFDSSPGLAKCWHQHLEARSTPVESYCSILYQKVVDAAKSNMSETCICLCLSDSG